jgi:hypothetical protein
LLFLLPKPSVEAEQRQQMVPRATAQLLAPIAGLPRNNGPASERRFTPALGQRSAHARCRRARPTILTWLLRSLSAVIDVRSGLIEADA